MLCYVMKKGCQKETNDSRDKDVGWVGLCRKNGRWNFKGPLKYVYMKVSCAGIRSMKCMYSF